MASAIKLMGQGKIDYFALKWWKLMDLMKLSLIGFWLLNWEVVFLIFKLSFQLTEVVFLWLTYFHTPNNGKTFSGKIFPSKQTAIVPFFLQVLEFGAFNLICCLLCSLAVYNEDTHCVGLARLGSGSDDSSRINETTTHGRLWSTSSLPCHCWKHASFGRRDAGVLQTQREDLRNLKKMGCTLASLMSMWCCLDVLVVNRRLMSLFLVEPVRSCVPGSNWSSRRRSLL